MVDIEGDWITVNAGLKSEGQIPAAQFRDDNGELTIAVGDEVKVALEAVEDGIRPLTPDTIAMMRDQSRRLVRFAGDLGALAQAEESAATMSFIDLDAADVPAAEKPQARQEVQRDPDAEAVQVQAVEASEIH